MPVVARLTDSDATDDASAFSAPLIDWGDGHVTPGVITGGAGLFEISGLHTYTGPAHSFLMGVSVATKDGEQSLATGGLSMATVDAGAATSGDATCLLQDDGSLSCWGENSDGEAVPPAGAFNAVTMTWNHGCALAGDGSVTCWGRDPSTPPSGAFVQVATGAAAAAHSCGLRPSGAVECW